VPTFTPDVVDAVLHHMNDDHTDDSLLIVRAFADEDATSATMTTLDEFGGTWTYATVDSPEREITVPWSTELSDRPQIRREVVLMYREACRRLGVEPRTE
jgi:hypothetical protein